RAHGERAGEAEAMDDAREDRDEPEVAVHRIELELDRSVGVGNQLVGLHDAIEGVGAQHADPALLVVAEHVGAAVRGGPRRREERTARDTEPTVPGGWLREGSE